MKRIGFLLAFVFLFASFGCVTAPEETPANYVCLDGSVVATQDECPSNEQEDATPLFDTWDLKAMKELGSPIRCILTTNNENYTSTITLYIQGNNMRYETYTRYYPQPDSYENTGWEDSGLMIVKGDWLYIQRDENDVITSAPEGCDWGAINEIKLKACKPDYPTTEESLEDISLGGRVDWEYQCGPAEFGSEKFETPGETCDTTDLMCGLHEAMREGEQ